MQTVISNPEKSYLSTDPKRNEVPSTAGGYILPIRVLPDGNSAEKERAAFADEALRKQMTLKEAEEKWYGHCDRIVQTHEKAKREKLLRAEEKAAQVADDEVSFDLEETICLRDKIVNDKNSPYWNDKAPIDEQGRLRALVHRYDTNIEHLRNQPPGKRATIRGYLLEYDRDRNRTFREVSENKKSSNGVSESDYYNPPRPKLEPEQVIEQYKKEEAQQ